MTALTLRIVARTLFDTDVTARIEEVARLGTEIQDFYYLRFASLRFLIPTWLPTPGNRRLAQLTQRLDDVVYGMIRERRPGEDRGDLLSMLLLTRDEHGIGMSERQVRDEVMTLLFAGHETTALALTWAFTLLDRHPEARGNLEAELVGSSATHPRRPRTSRLCPIHRPSSTRRCASIRRSTSQVARPCATPPSAACGSLVATSS